MSDPFLPMAPPLYPRRHFYEWGDRPESEKLLLMWVRGRSFHPYGENVPAREGWDPSEDLVGHLSIEGELVKGRMRWSYSFQRRSADPMEYGSGSGHSCASDCARAALEGIEEHEREAFESNLVVGVA